MLQAWNSIGLPPLLLGYLLLLQKGGREECVQQGHYGGNEYQILCKYFFDLSPERIEHLVHSPLPGIPVCDQTQAGAVESTSTLTSSAV